MISIEHLSAYRAAAIQDELVALLQNVVSDGASIGFIAPLEEDMACQYWQQIFEDVENGTRILLVAVEAGALLGTVQLELAAKENARHRAEVQKLMVHTTQRGRGISKLLLMEVEEAARRYQRPLLVLDTRRGDAAEHLYRKQGYICVGTIPQYARSSSGTLDDSVFFYRWLGEV